MVRTHKSTPITIQGQVSKLAKEFPSGIVVSQTPRSLKWEMDIRPSPNSRVYRIRIRYTLNEKPKINVIDPPVLQKAKGQDLLPHVYSTKEQLICLYFPPFEEWTPAKFIAKTIVPWASEWLLYYELWLITGEWLGEGIHHSSKNDIKKTETIESDKA